ncbi:hypothetical protein [Cellulomonas pakistanensis]|uniref:Uncharacterized protein n=1 Tax=Cellulomonas pakistanensis TaxID=992287 RepID=A0A919U822_9CELL|nr:hypothetical protein [Cellulomonas pakistanensis]GIG37557.1 hypothetical protein Cpa01nite_29380 [Cellulomonas pakistanensis]
MRLRKRRRAALPLDWVPPREGYYRGLGPNGEAVKRTGPPPPMPPTEEGIRRLERIEQAARDRAAAGAREPAT